jgi:hypothetical protein
LERVGDPEDPTEGSNVTLICRILFPGIKFPGPPEWEYQINNTAVMQTINITNPPAGDKPIGNYGGYRLVTVFLFFFIFYNSPAGIRIETEGEKKKHESAGFKLNFYVSRLELFNISKNTYTTFQCKANKFQDAVAKAISFQIKGKI